MAAPKVVAALQRIPLNGPIAATELSERLEQHGVRNLSAPDIWLACTEHGLAELEGDRWVLRGSCTPG